MVTIIDVNDDDRGKKKKPRIEINVPKLELWVAKFSSLRAPGSMQPLIQKR